MIKNFFRGFVGGIDNSNSFAVINILTATYWSYLLVGRWMRWTIFHGHGEYGWVIPGFVQYVTLVVGAVVPAGIVFLIVYAVANNFVRRRLHIVVYAVILLIVTMLIEFDVSWYKVSGRHISMNEVSIFMSENWKAHIGLRSSDSIRFLKLFFTHGVIFVFLLAISIYMGRKSAVAEVLSRTGPRLIAALVLLLAVDVSVAGYKISEGDRQWIAFSQGHPLRLSLLDRVYGQFSHSARAMADLNVMYTNAPVASHEGAVNGLANAVKPQGSWRPNIVILAIEGLNAKIALEHVSVLRQLQRTSVHAEHHYSTGDATHYGLLGLIHGRPITFYGLGNPVQSKYIDKLNGAGYVTRRFGADVTVFGQVGEYTKNFSMPTVEPKDDWAMLPEFAKYIKEEGSPKFAMVYYGGTHWPYLHGKKFSRHQPEVPADFDYSIWNLADYKEQVINRYVNALEELDAWLVEFLSTIDTERTLVVVTADHGEEMFEVGRMTHAGGVWRGQIQVPLFVVGPNTEHRKISTVTSHADVLPAVMAWIGLMSPKDLPSGGYAVAGHNNHTKHPIEWGFVGNEVKVHYATKNPGDVVVTGLTDVDDRPLDVDVQRRSSSDELARLFGQMKRHHSLNPSRAALAYD